MDNFGSSMMWYWLAYIAATLVGFLHTTFNVVVLKMSVRDENGEGDAYNSTRPWHILYDIIIFPLFALFYLKGLPEISMTNVVATSLIWGVITMVFDLFAWVLIQHPWSLTFKEFYVDYQPWISLLYLVIFASPFIAYLIMSMS